MARSGVSPPHCSIETSAPGWTADGVAREELDLRFEICRIAHLHDLRTRWKNARIFFKDIEHIAGDGSEDGQRLGLCRIDVRPRLQRRTRLNDFELSNTRTKLSGTEFAAQHRYLILGRVPFAG